MRILRVDESPVIKSQIVGPGCFWNPSRVRLLGFLVQVNEQA